MTEPTELLPCPFCGSKAVASINKDESLWSHDVVDWTRVHCTNDECNAQTEATCEGYEPSAIEVWNLRTPQPVVREPLTQAKVVEAFCALPHQVQFITAFDQGVRFAERHHGIKGGQHGTDT